MSRHANRDIEWGLSTLLVAFGIAIMVLPDVFSNPSFMGFANHGFDEKTAGMGVTGIGIVWMGGLLINGSWRRSPLLRLGCAILGTTLWGAIEAAFIASTASPSIAVYGAMFGFSVIACARCGRDAAKTVSRHERQGNGNAKLDA